MPSAGSPTLWSAQGLHQARGVWWNGERHLQGCERWVPYRMPAYPMPILPGERKLTIPSSDLRILQTPPDDERGWEAPGEVRPRGWGPVSASAMQGRGTSPPQHWGLQESHGENTQDLFACMNSTYSSYNSSSLRRQFYRFFYIACSQRNVQRQSIDNNINSIANRYRFSPMNRSLEI